MRDGVKVCDAVRRLLEALGCRLKRGSYILRTRPHVASIYRAGQQEPQMHRHRLHISRILIGCYVIHMIRKIGRVLVPSVEEMLICNLPVCVVPSEAGGKRGFDAVAGAKGQDDREIFGYMGRSPLIARMIYIEDEKVRSVRFHVDEVSYLILLWLDTEG